ncbi:MAG: HlyD family efflux transporter periplasmic adaptor subunit [Tepidisphaeraceae bacterium]
MAEQQTQPEIPTGRIRTPLAQQWKRVRYQLMPVVTMALAVAATAYLWRQHYSPRDGVGVVRVVEASATCPEDGLLVEPPGGFLGLHDRVSRDQIVARLDDRPLLAQLKVLQSDMTRLQLDLPAKEEALRIEQATRKDRQLDEARRLSINVETLQLAILQQKAQLETDQVEYQRQQALCDFIRKAVEKGAATEREMAEVTMHRDVVDQRIKGAQRSIVETTAQLVAAKERLNGHNDPAKVDADRIMAPIRAAIETQKARLDELQVQLQDLDIRSPIDGRITKIHYHPGETVKAGEAIVTITKDRSHQVVSYIRPDQHVAPVEGMPVQIRTRNGGRADVRISSVGPAFEQIPQHHQRDPKLVEWGIPVLIDVPAGLQLRSGETVDVRFNRTSAAASGT